MALELNLTALYHENIHVSIPHTEKLTIGRCSAFNITDPTISRKQARVEYRQGEWCLTCLGLNPCSIWHNKDTNILQDYLLKNGASHPTALPLIDRTCIMEKLHDENQIVLPQHAQIVLHAGDVIALGVQRNYTFLVQNNSFDLTDTSRKDSIKSTTDKNNSTEDLSYGICATTLSTKSSNNTCINKFVVQSSSMTCTNTGATQCSNKSSTVQSDIQTSRCRMHGSSSTGIDTIRHSIALETQCTVENISPCKNVTGFRRNTSAETVLFDRTNTANAATVIHSHPHAIHSNDLHKLMTPSDKFQTNRFRNPPTTPSDKFENDGVRHHRNDDESSERQRASTPTNTHATRGFSPKCTLFGRFQRHMLSERSNNSSRDGPVHTSPYFSQSTRAHSSPGSTMKSLSPSNTESAAVAVCHSTSPKSSKVIDLITPAKPISLNTCCTGEEVCAICQENIQSIVGILECNHKFCFNCIEAWSKISTTCCLCKQVFSSIRRHDTVIDHSTIVTTEYQVQRVPETEEYVGELEFSGCTICGSGADEHVLLLCDGCDAPFHTYCLPTPLQHVPEGDWYCQACESRQSNSSASVTPQSTGWVSSRYGGQSMNNFVYSQQSYQQRLEETASAIRRKRRRLVRQALVVSDSSDDEDEEHIFSSQLPNMSPSYVQSQTIDLSRST